MRMLCQLLSNNSTGGGSTSAAGGRGMQAAIGICAVLFAVLIMFAVKAACKSCKSNAHNDFRIMPSGTNESVRVKGSIMQQRSAADYATFVPNAH
ncbi:MAG: hypothetical protein P1U63_00460 [Coxiellaceae bacterium]|nr:hypothetical protein [Coxiellaceae bacterium]